MGPRHAHWRLPARHRYQSCVEDKYGVEIGGPSVLFKTVLPLYPRVRGLDGVNFATQTLWEGRIEAGAGYRYYRAKPGRQFVADATALPDFATAQYDFLLSSNCLEHIANPLKALVEWTRVLKVGGALILVVPNKENNFDRRRAVTTFGHLLDDFTLDVGEDDLTHLDEILALHDLRRDWPAGGRRRFRERSRRNFQNRTLHHHVFDVALIEAMLHHGGLRIVDVTSTRTDFFALAVKTGAA
ncbi:class I SAM-dependent methyltransferase [Mycobacterium sp. 94-17]|uniref:class I SAM-dependent methyltransferase n=1 Tax=Mycobacterium sp. 94-17 TaxID=2986147 RepID=UPI002D1E8DD1|nr:class I SAM-dependent methyltransferase [Mycobacterium sp. 94-17]MEB4209238.1 class I SAM-dependent methyltransferase [Mycobacterium sp. 94-17]